MNKFEALLSLPWRSANSHDSAAQGVGQGAIVGQRPDGTTYYIYVPVDLASQVVALQNQLHYKYKEVREAKAEALLLEQQFKSLVCDEYWGS